MNGLVQLVGQIYAYLTLMELGFGSAIIFKLYKPFAEGDKKKISELFVGSKRIYKKIGIFIFVGGMCSSIIAPFVINKGHISTFYVSTIFMLYAIDYLSLYLLSLPYQSVLIADQQKYKINVIMNIRHLIVKGLEIYLIIIKMDILLILLIGILANVISSIFIILQVKKYYPWLDKKEKPDLSSFDMTKDVIYHKISKLVFSNTDGIVLSIATNLRTVSIYGAYNYIIVYLRQIISMIFSAPLDSFGNVFSDNNTSIEKKRTLFYEFHAVGVYIGIIFVSILYISFTPFVISWIDESYKISTFAILLFSINLWFQILLYPLTIVRNANGLYKQSKGYTLLQAILNLILSLILVWKFGIPGVLLATTLSLIFIAYICEIRLVSNLILKIPFLYHLKYDIFAGCGLILLVTMVKIFSNIFGLYTSLDLFHWFGDTFIVFIIVFIVSTLIFYSFVKPFRLFLARLRKMMKK